jgi:hypothetical protein
MPAAARSKTDLWYAEDWHLGVRLWRQFGPFVFLDRGLYNVGRAAGRQRPGRHQLDGLAVAWRDLGLA